MLADPSALELVQRMSRIRLTAILAVGLVAAGCGGGDSGVSASTRVERCLEQQPESTKAQCEGWEKDGELADDGTHERHEEM